MSAENKEPRGRIPAGKRWGPVNIDEMHRSYSDTERVSVAVAEMESFLQGSGIEGATTKEACSDPLVIGLFTVSRLFGIDVHAELGKWLAAEDWQRVEKWKNLCNQWHDRWKKPRLPEPNQGNFMAVWRLACMVEGWRLLDEYYLRGPLEDLHLIPSVDEIAAAALDWLAARGVARKSTENIRNKDKREFEKIALGWIPTSGLKKPPASLFPDGEDPAIMIHGPQGTVEELEKRMAEYDAERGDAAEQELNALRGLNWPE